VVTDAKEGKSSALTDATTRWYANADQIAAFLAGANPNWPLADLTDMMHQHLHSTLAEATARLTSDWSGDIAAYDAIETEILDMADALSDGIAKQFPSDFQ
jgi:hypothetical protein